MISRTPTWGASPGARNLISGNGAEGVKIDLASTGSTVEGNLIGTRKDGATPLSNGAAGVRIAGSTGSTIGGALPGTANTIAFNGGDGVAIVKGPGPNFRIPTGNSILRNSIFSNADLGIDLKDDGVTANDFSDADGDENNLQNFLVLISARTSSTATRIKGTLTSTPGETFTLRFFSNPSGTREEGKKFVGEKGVSDGDGVVSFAFKPKAKIKAGLFVTATATSGATGDTSEFSAPRKVSRA